MKNLYKEEKKNVVKENKEWVRFKEAWKMQSNVDENFKSMCYKWVKRVNKSFSRMNGIKNKRAKIIWNETETRRNI